MLKEAEKLVGGEWGEGYTPSDPPSKFLLSIPVILCSAGLEVLVPEGGRLPVGDTIMIPLKWKLRQPPSHSGFLLPLNQQVQSYSEL